jgi:hypothetical protein
MTWAFFGVCPRTTNAIFKSFLFLCVSWLSPIRRRGSIRELWDNPVYWCVTHWLHCEGLKTEKLGDLNHKWAGLQRLIPMYSSFELVEVRMFHTDVLNFNCLVYWLCLWRCFLYWTPRVVVVFTYLFFSFFLSREFVRGYELPRPIQYLCWSPVGSKLVSV